MFARKHLFRSFVPLFLGKIGTRLQSRTKSADKNATAITLSADTDHCRRHEAVTLASYEPLEL
jgi:hypothetical protein